MTLIHPLPSTNPPLTDVVCVELAPPTFVSEVGVASVIPCVSLGALYQIVSASPASPIQSVFVPPSSFGDDVLVKYIPKAVLIVDKSLILCESRAFFKVSTGLRRKITIAPNIERMAITIKSSSNVKPFLIFFEFIIFLKTKPTLLIVLFYRYFFAFSIMFSMSTSALIIYSTAPSSFPFLMSLS